MSCRLFNFSIYIADKFSVKHWTFLILITFSSCSQNGLKFIKRRPSSISHMGCFSAINGFPKEKSYYLGAKRTEPLATFDEQIQVTQFLYGRPGVINRKREIRNLSFDELLDYLKEKPIPYVLGPNGMKYIIDRHHFSRSLFELKSELSEKFGTNAKEIKIYFQKVEFDEVNPQDLSDEEFVELMKDNKLTYLKHSNGKMRPFEKLPLSVGGLEEDYFRGLSWLVRKSGAYKKSDIPFAEFYWGEYLKKNLSLDKLKYSKKNIRKAIRLALTFSDEASKLPGFKGAIGMDELELEDLVKKSMKKLKKKNLFDLEGLDEEASI